MTYKQRLFNITINVLCALYFPWAFLSLFFSAFLFSFACLFSLCFVYFFSGHQNAIEKNVEKLGFLTIKITFLMVYFVFFFSIEMVDWVRKILFFSRAFGIFLGFSKQGVIRIQSYHKEKHRFGWKKKVIFDSI